MQSMYSRISLHRGPFGNNSCTQSIQENENKKQDKEVRAVCCQQRAPDVKDIQISAWSTLPHSSQIAGDMSMKEKTPRTKSLLFYNDNM